MNQRPPDLIDLLTQGPLLERLVCYDIAHALLTVDEFLTLRAEMFERMRHVSVGIY